ncbi:MAG: DUF4249 family protein [Bacteroidales bacterium]|nr:DUF4249 family protein [Bacteroidales bacterium]
MKKIFLTILAITALILTSCKNTVDIYSNSGDSTIVYAMLDPGLDTNFFKITKSFVGNANQFAQNYDANNYGYDEIDVRFGRCEHSTITQAFPVDTISVYLPYDTTSIFYNGCRQTYYYTKKKLEDGKKYRLEIFRKADSVTVSTEITTLSTFGYKTNKMLGIYPNFNMQKDNGLIAWAYSNDQVSKATYFDITLYFSYIENPGASQTKQTIVWNIGSGTEETLWNSNDNIYNIRMKPSSFFSILENDEHLRNTQASSRRIIDTIEIKVSGIGEDLYNYYLVNNSSSAIQDVPNYSNIENGVGLTSARSSSLLLSKILKESLDKIVEDFPQYNFYYNP